MSRQPNYRTREKNIRLWGEHADGSEFLRDFSTKEEARRAVPRDAKDWTIFELDHPHIAGVRGRHLVSKRHSKPSRTLLRRRLTRRSRTSLRKRISRRRTMSLPKVPAWRTRAAFYVKGRWKWLTWTNDTGNSHKAILDKADEIGADKWDFGGADHMPADRANY